MEGRSFMYRKFVLPTLLVGTLLAVFSPASALARDQRGSGGQRGDGRGNSGGRGYSGGQQYSGGRNYSGGRGNSGGRDYFFRGTETAGRYTLARRGALRASR